MRYMAMGGVGSGGGTLASPRSRCCPSKLGAVTSNGLWRKKAGTPAKPGTVATNRLEKPCFDSKLSIYNEREVP